MLLVDLPGIAIFVGDSRVRKAEQVSPVPSPARPLHGLGRGVVLRRGATPRTMESSASPASSTPLSPLVLTANNVPRYCPMSLGGQSHLQLRAPVLEAQRISAKIKSPSEQQADPPPSDVRAFTRTRRRVRGPPPFSRVCFVPGAASFHFQRYFVHFSISWVPFRVSHKQNGRGGSVFCVRCVRQADATRRAPRPAVSLALLMRRGLVRRVQPLRARDPGDARGIL